MFSIEKTKKGKYLISPEFFFVMKALLGGDEKL